ncbi:hypothetical protein ACIQBJ_14905 [Kitasatospora sp. NPDC088391]|uniref:hypothetical protein n=1 Tax=Kitasatospora sp. NPDC088391 TaxID=3364074 RepID=UPI003818BF92
MSVIVEFFAAPDDASAALAAPTGPGRALPARRFGNFDAEGAILEWESALTGDTVEALIEADEPRWLTDPDNSGCLVLALSPRLTTALAAAAPAQLDRTVGAWTAEDPDLAPETAAEILTEVAALATTAHHNGDSLYCWTA